MAIGRRANTDALDLAAGGLDNERGRIIVNDKMETNVSGVYAIGDCVFGHAQLAHTASAMGEVAAENIMGIPAVYDERTNPTCVYIEPEAASVGLTEEQAKAQGIDYIVGKFPMNANGKTVHMIGLPWHFGWLVPKRGGDSANLLTAAVGDPNSAIPESKAFMVNIEKMPDQDLPE